MATLIAMASNLVASCYGFVHCFPFRRRTSPFDSNSRSKSWSERRSSGVDERTRRTRRNREGGVVQDVSGLFEKGSLEMEQIFRTIFMKRLVGVLLSLLGLTMLQDAVPGCKDSC